MVAPDQYDSKLISPIGMDRFRCSDGKSLVKRSLVSGRILFFVSRPTCYISVEIEFYAD